MLDDGDKSRLKTDEVSVCIEGKEADSDDDDDDEGGRYGRKAADVSVVNTTAEQREDSHNMKTGWDVIIADTNVESGHQD